MPSRDEAFKTYRPRWLISAAVILLLSGLQLRTIAAPERAAATQSGLGVSSLLTTAGGLVFAGEPTGEFNAYDAHAGELL
jgi:predicted deacetylase